MVYQINEDIAKIESLIKEGDLKQAYLGCNKLLLNFPENGKLRKIQKYIEKTVYEQNVKIVEKDLENIKPLWKEKRYKEIVEKLGALKQYVPGYRSVEKDLIKAQKLYAEQVMSEQKNAIEDYIRNIEKLINEGKFQDAVVESRKFLSKIPNHEKVVLLEKKARDLLVIQKLKENESLLKSNNFKEIESLLADLLKISPDSNKLKILFDKASKKESVVLSYEKKDFAFQSMEYIRVLMQKKKWDKAVQALLELLNVEPNNLTALEMLDKARGKFDRQLTKEVIAKIKELQGKFRAQKVLNPKSFIRL